MDPVALLVAAVFAVCLITAWTLARGIVRWVVRLQPQGRTPDQPSRAAARRPPPYGRLPTPADPVGPLGSLAPGADLSSSGGDERDLLGEP